MRWRKRYWKNLKWRDNHEKTSAINRTDETFAGT